MSTSSLTIHRPSVRIRVLPGVWRPHHDAALVGGVVARGDLARDADVLDLFTGSGALAVATARLGARSVTAVDISRRALLTTRLNAWRNGVEVATRRSDLFSALGDATFDLILANPPYYPGTSRPPRRGTQRAWDGGRNGRVLIDALCARAPARLRPGGRLLMVHATFNGEQESLRALRDGGLHAEVVHRHRGPWGDVGRARVAGARRAGADVDDGEEETIVVCATRTARAPDR